MKNLVEIEPNTLNNKIIELNTKRLEMGSIKYGGDMVSDDPRAWAKEALEEALDLAVYLSAQLLTIELMKDKE